jgi:hypothetical protein
MPGDLVVGVQQELDHVVLRLRGCLFLRNVPRVRETTVKTLLSTGRVLIDLSRLRSPQGALVTVFPTALAGAGGWPAAGLVLFGADTAMRAMLLAARIPDTVQLAADLTPARVCSWSDGPPKFDATATYRCTTPLREPRDCSYARSAPPGQYHRLFRKLLNCCQTSW